MRRAINTTKTAWIAAIVAGTRAAVPGIPGSGSIRAVGACHRSEGVFPVSWAPPAYWGGKGTFP